MATTTAPGQTEGSTTPEMSNSTHIIQKEFTRVEYQQPHWKRRKDILKAHPEIMALTKPDPSTGLWAIILFGFQFWSIYTIRDYDWWVIFTVAYCVGAFVDHALLILVHEFGHQSGFQTKFFNNAFLLFCNIPHIIPLGVTFTYYHKQHHIHLNEIYDDPDIPGPLEQKIFGTTTIGKMTYLFLFAFVQAYRTARYGPMYFDRWVAANYLLNLPTAYAVYHFWGLRACIYMFSSFFFSIGLHPVGARWFAEHYAVREEQETYSYYGPINQFAFNIGHHNEHHDLPRVPWSRLPTVRKIASEFYDPLYSHPSYVGLLMEFFFNPNFTLETRVVRENRSASKALEDIYETRDYLKKKL